MDEVKIIRKEVGMKQFMLAYRLGIEQSNYANIENGKMIPNNLAFIKERALEILLPLFDNKIAEEQQRLKNLVSLRNKLTLGKNETKI